MVTKSSRYPRGLSDAESPLIRIMMKMPATESTMLNAWRLVGGSLSINALKISVTIGMQAITMPLSVAVVSAMPQVSTM